MSVPQAEHKQRSLFHRGSGRFSVGGLCAGPWGGLVRAALEEASRSALQPCLMDRSPVGFQSYMSWGLVSEAGLKSWGPGEGFKSFTPRGKLGVEFPPDCGSPCQAVGVTVRLCLSPSCCDVGLFSFTQGFFWRIRSSGSGVWGGGPLEPEPRILLRERLWYVVAGCFPGGSQDPLLLPGACPVNC